MRSRTPLATLLVAVLVGAASIVASGPTTAAGRWAPAGKAKIHPGTMMYTKGAQCTANFVYTDGAGRVYVGYAAHCAGTGAQTDTNGCQTKSVPLGTRVRFTNDGNPGSGGTTVGRGRLVYSSWRTMHRLHTKAKNVCAYNDLALVRVSRRTAHKVNPSVPSFGGPTGARSVTLSAGDKVYTYGNSSLRGGISQLSPKYGTSVGDDKADGGWSHPVYTVTPGIPGDSGSGLLNAKGRAIGVLSTVALAPLAGSNNFGDLGKELAFARRHSGIAGLHLVHGTKPFKPAL
jgi:hypothetical protein